MVSLEFLSASMVTRLSSARMVLQKGDVVNTLHYCCSDAADYRCVAVKRHHQPLNELPQDRRPDLGQESHIITAFASKQIMGLLALLIILVARSAGICQDGMSPALASLVEAERAFARASVEKGVRESFFEFFADDGIYFVPHPTRTREAILKQPAPATKAGATLNWRPVYADVSQAGDLGYTTGPWTWTDQSEQKRPSRYGFYFSIWKKQSDGAWKVVVDCGITTPDHSTQVFVFSPAPESKPVRVDPHISLEADRLSLIDLDGQFLKQASDQGLSRAYMNFVSDHARLERDGSLPILGKDAIKTYLGANAFHMNWRPIKSDLSRSRDLGYTYGSYELATPKSTELEKGYYVRVWKRVPTGRWKLVLDTLSPIPTSTK